MSPLRVLGVLLGLALLAAALGLAGAGGGGPLDPDPLVASIFRGGALPEGYAVAEASRLRSGERVLRLVRAGAEGSAAPEELVLVRFPSLRTAAELFRDEGDGSGGDGGGGRGPGGAQRKASADVQRWTKDPSFAFHLEIERGRVAWDRWQAEFRVERAYREGGGTQELTSVNLAQEERPLVLFARWPEASGHAQVELERLLGSIAMLPPAAPPPALRAE